MLYREFYRHDGAVDRLQIVVPPKLRYQFLQQLHESSENVGTTHLGLRKTEAHVHQRAYWPKWRSDVERYCRRCVICQSVQHGIAPRHGEMQLYEPNGFGDRLHIDLTGPHPPSRQGSIYILTAIDAYTRFLVAVPLRNKMAVTVADALVERILLPLGCFRTIVSDQGTEFCNELLAEVTSRLGIQKLNTTAYRASSNGRVERVHRTMNSLISKHIGENQKSWQDSLQTIVTAYNASVHESTNYSPYFLVYGREYRTPLDLTIAAPEIPINNKWDYVDQMETRLQTAYQDVNQRLKTTTQRMKKRYDARVRPLRFEVGDFVWYYCPRKKSGRYQKWRRLCTIWRVEKVLNDVNYCIRSGPRGRSLIAHIDRLRPFEGELPHGWKGHPHANENSPHAMQNGPHATNSDPHANGRNHASTSPLHGSRAAAAPPMANQSQPHQYNLRPAYHRRRPAKLRNIQSHNTVSSDSTVKTSEVVHSSTMEPSTSSLKRKRSIRSEAQKRRRAEMRKGPWTCLFCNHEPYGSITGYKAHVVLQHDHYCSNTGQVEPFDSDEQRQRVVESVKKGREHRSRLKSTTLSTPSSVPVDETAEGTAPDSTTTFCSRISSDAHDYDLLDDVDLLDFFPGSVAVPDEVGPPSTTGGDEVQQQPPWPMESVSSINGVEEPALAVGSVKSADAAEPVVDGPSSAAAAIVGSDVVEVEVAPVAAVVLSPVADDVTSVVPVAEAVVVEPARQSNGTPTDSREMGDLATVAALSPPVDAIVQTNRGGRRLCE